MHDVESHTVCYLRDVLVTRAHLHPEITSFLTMWNYEEFWHGEAIGRVLAAHDEAAGAGRIAALRQRLPKGDRWKPLGFQIASAITPHLTAIHMTWGAVNELTTQAAYARLAELGEHPTLSTLLRRIMKQEGRHIDFYATRANGRLAGSRAARRVTRWTLRRFWSPVGTGVVPDSEVDFLRTYVFGDPNGQATAERIDRRVDRLPGLDGLNLLVAAAAPDHGVDGGGRTRPVRRIGRPARHVVEVPHEPSAPAPAQPGPGRGLAPRPSAVHRRVRAHPAGEGPRHRLSGGGRFRPMVR
ncbi:MAG: ferritin-like domain-containing protein [Acidimicrobiales bacterium]